MRTPLISLAALALVAVTPARAGHVSPFDLDCVESETAIQSVQPVLAQPEGEVCHYGQLTRQDLSYVESVRPSPVEPLQPLLGEVCHSGQLTREDLSYVESVQADEAAAPAIE